MGEIADALRRSREQPTSTERDRPQAWPSPGPSRSPRPYPHGGDSAAGGLAPDEGAGEADSETPGERVLHALSPLAPAIATSDGPFAEACRTLAVRIRSELERRGAISAAIVSAAREEGKTTVLCDLGLALASLSAGREVALVDLDLRKPSLAKTLGIRADRGVEHVLRRGARLNEVRISVEHPALDLYPAIEPQRAAHELFALPGFSEMIRELERRYAVVLMDTPPTLPVPDTSLILKHVGVCIPVARSGHTRARLFRQLIEVLPRHQILGALLNDAPMPVYQYYDYGRHDEGREEHADSEPTTARKDDAPSQP